jgi:transposase InsO family protein
VQIATDNGWGHRRIHGELLKLGIRSISPSTVGRILRQHGFEPGPKRGYGTWHDFVQRHLKTLWACDFFTTTVWNWRGPITYYVLFFIHLESRRIEVAGMTPHPNERWMNQIARNVTMDGWGFLEGCHYVIHDRDSKYCQSFRDIIESADVKTLPLPARSPNLNAFSERWVKSVKDDCLSKLILFGETSLRRALHDYQIHYHAERKHQGKGNVLLFPTTQAKNRVGGSVRCKERLGGLLKYYHLEVA